MVSFSNFVDGIVHFGVCVFFVIVCVELLGVQWRDVKEMMKK